MWVDVGRCPKCGGRMISPMVWYGTTPTPKRCVNCGYEE